MSSEAPVAQMLADVGHRPFALPKRRWFGRQSWNDLLLAHWPVPVEAVQARLPAGLEADTFEGQAYVSLVAFRMANVRLRGVPRACSLVFPELNVRTYVRRGGRAGVFFHSLDADNALTVAIGERFFGLPYRGAAMRMTQDGAGFAFQSARRNGAATFEATYTPGAALPSPAGSLPYWLMERYCFWSAHRGALLRCDIHHAPWGVHAVEAVVRRNEGLVSFAEPAAVLHYSPGVDVVFWSAEREN